MEVAEAKITEAVRAGRCTDAQRGVAMQLAMSDTELFDEWLRTAPVVVPLGRTVAPALREGGSTAHTIAAQARAEYRAHRELAALTSEDSYVADAVRRHVVGAIV